MLPLGHSVPGRCEWPSVSRGRGIATQPSAFRSSFYSLSLSIVLWALMTAPAHASIWLNFERERGVPGQSVNGYLLQGALRGDPVETYPIFLASRERSNVTDPNDPELKLIGTLAVEDSWKGGTVSFKVPSLQAGMYLAYLHCEPCAPASGNRSIFAVGEFEVLAVDRESLPSTGNKPWLPGAVAFVLLGLLLVAYGTKAKKRSLE